jgi:hypothetical protein
MGGESCRENIEMMVVRKQEAENVLSAQKADDG